eukprot:jgi/Botrbrau1/22311/Bobra.0138s0061.1
MFRQDRGSNRTRVLQGLVTTTIWAMSWRAQGEATPCRTRFLPLPYPALDALAWSIEPQYMPNTSALTGLYEENELLDASVRLFDGRIKGSESIHVDMDGNLIMCDKFGAVWKARPDGFASGGYALDPDPVAQLSPGRPLGFLVEPRKKGALLVCQAGLGLLRVDLNGTKPPEILSTRVSRRSARDPGTRVQYIDDLDVAPDGTIYFTDAGGILPIRNGERFWDTWAAFRLVAMQGDANGRVLRYDPKTQETVVLGKDLFFANGIAISANGSFLVITESIPARISRLWLTGPKAGTRDFLIENLPGHPDGIDRAEDGSFWISIINRPTPILGAILSHWWSRYAVAWGGQIPLLYSLPLFKLPFPKPWGCVIKVSPEGEVLKVLMDADGSRVRSISAVTEHKGRLFLGNLDGNYVSYYDLNKDPKASDYDLPKGSLPGGAHDVEHRASREPLRGLGSFLKGLSPNSKRVA